MVDLVILVNNNQIYNILSNKIKNMEEDKLYILTVIDKKTQKSVTDVRSSEDIKNIFEDFEIDGFKDMIDYLNNKLNEDND
jgi:hypothetical protein